MEQATVKNVLTVDRAPASPLAGHGKRPLELALRLGFSACAAVVVLAAVAVLLFLGGRA